jgi:inositol hexakisphosphate/diphosphoinositol-pentakisphosphate kinase
MEKSLSRSVSTESTRSWQQPSGSSAAVSGESVGRASVSVGPSGAQAIRQMPSRRTSKASDSILDFFGQARNYSNSNNGCAVDVDTDLTPTLEGRAARSLLPANALMLPQTATATLPEAATENNNRLSFTSLISIGSAIYGNSRGNSWSGRSSIVGSDSSEGTYVTPIFFRPAAAPPVHDTDQR